jgi:hypothetical protein
MFAYGYEMDVNIENVSRLDLHSFRQKISELYEFIDGEKPTWVMFDKEIEEQNKLEDDMDKQRDDYFAQVDKGFYDENNS